MGKNIVHFFERKQRERAAWFLSFIRGIHIGRKREKEDKGEKTGNGAMNMEANGAALPLPS